MIHKRPALPRPPRPEVPRPAAIPNPRTRLRDLSGRREQLLHELEMVEVAAEELAIESICGNRDDTQDVELYDGTLGVPRAFVDSHEPMTGQLQWLEDLPARFSGPGESPGNVAGARWGSGGLIRDDLFLTAGHCFDSFGGGWERPRRGGQVIEPPEIATLMRVVFRYQVDGATGAVRAGSPFPVLELLEYRLGGLDFAIARLGRNEAGALPGEVFGRYALAEKDVVDPGAMLCLIQHPNGLPKRIEAGPMLDNQQGVVRYDSLDTLGGSSGSLILSAAGEVVGVHTNGGCSAFSGANRGVAIGAIRSFSLFLDKPAAPEEAAPEEARRRVEDYADRAGYRADFLGDGTVVPLPVLSTGQRGDAARGPDGSVVIPYTHFSLAMSRQRRLAYYTACNIDGRQLRRFPRGRDRWLLDPRVGGAQVGNELYVDNDLDRGHLVRRLDPVWGSEEEARLAQDDTFHYSNAAPQHKDLNREVWVDLEDYILDNTDVHDLRVSVFTGPVFKASDPQYRGLGIPQEFWKVVVARVGEDDRLSATAYLLSQADMISDLEFAFGRFRTFQVRVSDVEARTGIGFGELRDHDPLGDAEMVGRRPLGDASEIVL